LIGPFTPQLGREIWVTLSGAGSSGTAQLLRSTDGGATKLGLTVAGQPWGSFPFAGITDLAPAANEIVTAETDASATYYLALTVTQGTGTIAWRSEMPARAPNQGYRAGYRPLTQRVQNPRFLQLSLSSRRLIPPPRFRDPSMKLLPRWMLVLAVASSIVQISTAIGVIVLLALGY
jgi:hypothetical protein